MNHPQLRSPIPSFLSHLPATHSPHPRPSPPSRTFSATTLQNHSPTPHLPAAPSSPPPTPHSLPNPPNNPIHPQLPLTSQPRLHRRHLPPRRVPLRPQRLRLGRGHPPGPARAPGAFWGVLRGLGRGRRWGWSMCFDRWKHVLLLADPWSGQLKAEHCAVLGRLVDGIDTSSQPKAGQCNHSSTK